MAFCETNGDFEVDDTEDGSGFLFPSSLFLISWIPKPDSTGFGSVTVIPKIFPGGNDSICLPDSVEAKRRAIASSTACCRFKAT